MRIHTPVKCLKMESEVNVRQIQRSVWKLEVELVGWSYKVFDAIDLFLEEM